MNPVKSIKADLWGKHGYSNWEFYSPYIGKIKVVMGASEVSFDLSQAVSATISSMQKKLSQSLLYGK